MSTGSISLDILLNKILTDAISGGNESIRAIQKRYPSLSEKEAHEILAMVSATAQSNDDSDIVQIDSRADVIIFSSSVVTAKMDLMQRFFGFEQYIRAGAQKTIEIIRDLDIVDSLEKFVAFENKSKLTNAKKLLKAKNSPVLQMKKNDLLENLKKHSRYKTMFKFEEDHIVISSQKEAAAFIKMLNDDIVRSELTGKEYDSSSKMLLGPVGASH